MFAATGHGVYRSEDNGAHWQRASTGLDPSQVRALAQVGNRLFAGTEMEFSGAIIEATPGPLKGELTGVDGCFSLATMGTILFQGWGLGVERSDDRGESWEETSNGLPHEDVRTIVVVGTKLFVGTEKGVFRSDDKGQSWREVNNGLSTGIFTSSPRSTISCSPAHLWVPLMSSTLTQKVCPGSSPNE